MVKNAEISPNGAKFIWCLNYKDYIGEIQGHSVYILGTERSWAKLYRIEVFWKEDKARVKKVKVYLQIFRSAKDHFA